MHIRYYEKYIKKNIVNSALLWYNKLYITGGIKSPYMVVFANQGIGGNDGQNR